MSDLKWLPQKLNIENYNSIIELVSDLYKVFEKDFKQKTNSLIFNGKEIRIASLPLHIRCEKLTDLGMDCQNTSYNCSNCPYINKEDIFNHITCSELNSKFRTPGIFELERAVRLPWIRAIIENCDNEHTSIRYYEAIVKNSLRKCFWLNAEKYLVILTEGENGDLFLTSAYYLYNRKRSDRANRDYKAYCKNIKKTP